MTYLCASLSGEDCFSTGELAIQYEGFVQKYNTDPDYRMETGVNPLYSDLFLWVFSFGLTDVIADQIN